MMTELLRGLSKTKSIGLILDGRNSHPLKIGRIASLSETYVEMQLLSIYGRKSNDSLKIPLSKIIAVLFNEDYLRDLDHLSENMPPAGTLTYSYVEDPANGWIEVFSRASIGGGKIISVFVGDEPEFVAVINVEAESNLITFERYNDQGLVLGMYTVLLEHINKVRYGGDAEYAVNLLSQRRVSND
jgi:hypothetical protein